MELIVVVAIIGILSGTAYIGIQKGKTRMYNDKVLDDVTGIANALERYNHDHWGEYPVPDVDGNMNISCFYADATYAHDCDTSAFRQGMIDSNLLTRRYMPEVPTDPRTGSRYVYGVSTDGKYFMVGGNYEESSGQFVAKTAGNLKKGYHLPSLIRAFNGPNFVMEDGTNLPYSPDHIIITATLQNMSDSNQVTVTDGSNTVAVTDGMTIYTGYTVTTTGSTLDIYYSDGSISNLDTGSSMEILEGTEVEENDKDGIITKIRIKLTSGKIWNKVARLASASEFNVETTTAIAGVRGTEFGVDAGTNQVLLKSGEICRMNIGAEIPVNVVKDCTGSYAIAGLDANVSPVMIGMNAGATATGGAPSGDLKTLMETQSLRYLNDNIRPHILKVDGLTITVENLRTYYDLPMSVNLEVAELEALDNAGNTVGSLVMTDLSLTDDYELIITATSYENPIILRFTDDIGPDSGDSIPITITAETSLTGKDLYGIPESVEWVDPYEEIIICDATTMVISGDATFSAGSDDTNKNVTLVWSVTPVECFDGATYSGEAGLDMASLTAFTATDSMHHSLGDIENGSDYYWNVTASVGVDDYSYPASDTVLFTVPATPTWCGDGFLNGDEECDDTAMPGCIMIGAYECTCNGDLGWTADVGGGCVCDATITSVITLTTPEVAINGSLMWDVTPTCAFEGATYNLDINGNDVTGSTSTSITLTDSEVATVVNPGGIYPLLVSAFGPHTSITDYNVGDFTVLCSDVADDIGLISPTDGETIAGLDTATQFEWQASTPECLFDDPSLYNYTFEIIGETGCVYESSSPTTTSINLTPTCISALTLGTEYEWKITRQDDLGSTASSASWKFTPTTGATCGNLIVDAGEECDDGNTVPGDGCDAFCQWEPIVEINGFVAGEPYYATNTGIQLIHNGFDAGFNLSTNTTVIPSTGFGWIGDMFNASVPGEYELNSTYGSDTYTLYITICGYVDDGSECWVLGSAGDNCDVACPDILGSGFICDTSLTWNDNTSCSICNVLTGNTVCGPQADSWSPHASGPLCRYRGAGNQDCLSSPTGSESRICKCE